MLAHRVAWQLLGGKPVKGLVLDHLCRVQICVNPAHLEQVTQQENTLRGEGTAALNARKTICVNGHEFDEENTRWLADGRRECKTCRTETYGRWDERQKVSA